MPAFPSPLRNAVRSLVRTPAVTLSAIACLALGIGATTAIASAVSRALLQSLPFRDPESLVAVHRITPQSGPMGTWPSSAPNYVDLARETRALSGLAAVSNGSALVTLRDEAIQASQLYITGNFFALLGAQAARGRFIEPDDDRVDQPIVAVLSWEFWNRRLGADPAVVGSTMLIDGEPTVIAGIAPRDFRVPYGGGIMRADVWMPIRFTAQRLTARRSNYLWMVGRLAPGATVPAAERELRAIFDRIVEANPDVRGEGIRVAALHPESVASVRTPLLLLFGAVCLVLLIACTNVAALLLARGVHRRREIAVRTALGATRWDTMRLALGESALIALAGTVIGVGLAAIAVRSIGRLAAAQLPQLAGMTMDSHVVAFAVLLSLLVTLLCGAAPAWRSASVDPQDALRGGRGGGAGRAHHRALRGLVVGEIATSFVLLVGAALVLKAFVQLISKSPGFETAHVLTLRVTTSPNRYTATPATEAFIEPALERIRAIPGVEAAGSISAVPYVSWGNNGNVRYEGMPKDDPTRQPLVETRGVSTGFFAVTGQRLISGRLLRTSDDGSAPSVVVVNQALVARDFGGKDPVGRRFHLTDSTFGTIVGVVSNIRNMGPLEEPKPEMYWTYAQGWQGTSIFPFMVRVRSGDPAAVTPQLRAAIRMIDPTAAIADIAPMESVIARSLGAPRFYLSLLGSFAAVAIVLAIAGLYGVLSYAVAQRTREFGIQLALGSPPRMLLRRVTGQGLRLVVVGLVIGLAGAALVTRLMRFMLYGVSPLDTITWIGTTLLLVAAGALAAFLPARRAVNVDPVRAIQAE